MPENRCFFFFKLSHLHIRFFGRKMQSNSFSSYCFIHKLNLSKFGINKEISKFTATPNHMNLSKIEICVIYDKI